MRKTEGSKVGNEAWGRGVCARLLVGWLGQGGWEMCVRMWIGKVLLMWRINVKCERKVGRSGRKKEYLAV